MERGATSPTGYRMAYEAVHVNRADLLCDVLLMRVGQRITHLERKRHESFPTEKTAGLFRAIGGQIGAIDKLHGDERLFIGQLHEVVDAHASTRKPRERRTDL